MIDPDPDAIARIRELRKDPAVQRIAAQAPPPPEAALHLLHANGFPLQTVTAPGRQAA